MPEEIIECVPNFSTGRDPEVLEKILQPFRETEGMKILDYSSDKDHNRSVVTLLGNKKALLEAIPKAVGIAAELIDLRKHEGAHPRMGATDVIPFIPIANCDMEDCKALALEVSKVIGEELKIPVYLYEESASSPERKNLSKVRKGQFEGFAEKIKEPMWKPDFGPDEIHESAGVTAVGARMPLVAYNINLASSNLSIADAIAKKIRHIGGGLRYVKAMGVDLAERGIVQVSINMTNFKKSSLYQVFEMVKLEASRYGVNVLGSEIIGLTPMEALTEAAAFYLRLEDFDPSQIIENRLLN